MGNRAAARLPGRDRGSAGTGQSGLAVFGPLFGGTAIKRPWYCATQQGARHPRWKPHGLVPAYQAVNKTRWDTAVEPGAPFPFPHSPALQKQIRRKRKSVQPVFPLPWPRCYTTPLSFPLSTHRRTLNHTDSALRFFFHPAWKLFSNSNIHDNKYLPIFAYNPSLCC